MDVSFTDKVVSSAYTRAQYDADLYLWYRFCPDDQGDHENKLPSLQSLALNKIVHDPKPLLKLDLLNTVGPYIGEHLPYLLKKLRQCFKVSNTSGSCNFPFDLWLAFVQVYGATGYISYEFRDYSHLVLNDVNAISSITNIMPSPGPYSFTLMSILDLSDTDFDDDCCSQLSTVAHTAMILKLNGTKISDYGIHKLQLATRSKSQRLWKSLCYFGLRNTNVTDSCIPRLASFNHVIAFDLRQTLCTTTGCAKFASLPESRLKMATSKKHLKIFCSKFSANQLFYYLYSTFIRRDIQLTAPDYPFTLTIRNVSRLAPPDGKVTTNNNKQFAHMSDVGKVYSNVNIHVPSLHEQSYKNFQVLPLDHNGENKHQFQYTNTLEHANGNSQSLDSNWDVLNQDTNIEESPFMLVRKEVTRVANQPLTFTQAFDSQHTQETQQTQNPVESQHRHHHSNQNQSLRLKRKPSSSSNTYKLDLGSILSQPSNDNNKSNKTNTSSNQRRFPKRTFL